VLICIGILAWNEEALITATLESLFHQTVFAGDQPASEHHWHILVVPNGCRDRTAAVARDTLVRLCAGMPAERVTWDVHELAEPGKSNAWNALVHELAPPASGMFVMMDADIEFGSERTVENCVRALLQDGCADAVVDLPLKDVVKKSRRTWLETISASASEFSTSGPPAISGQFYCARAEVLRRIWMPRGLSVEDGFLTAMVMTDCFRAPIDPRKLVRAADASHYYETLTTLRAIFHHELRIVVGTATNCYFLWDFLRFATDPVGGGAGELIRHALDRDPNWYAAFIRNSVQTRGFWVLPGGMLLRRLHHFSASRGRPWWRRIAVLLAGMAMDLPVMLAANRQLKGRGAIGFW
jgi:glycosyltransferase involved in cell wall biosynthesis